MGIKDQYYVNKKKYMAKLKKMKPEELKKIYIQKQRKSIGSSVGVGAAVGVGLTVVTGGLALPIASVVGATIGGRRFWVLGKKLKYIEREMNSRGIPIPDLTLKDWVIGAGPGLLGAAVLPGVDQALGGIASSVVSSATDPTIFSAAATTLQSPHAVGGAIGDAITGAGTMLQSTAHHVTHSMHQHVYNVSAPTPTHVDNAFAYNGGVTAGKTIISKGASKGITQAFEKGEKAYDKL